MTNSRACLKMHHQHQITSTPCLIRMKELKLDSCFLTYYLPEIQLSFTSDFIPPTIYPARSRIRTNNQQTTFQLTECLAKPGEDNFTHFAGISYAPMRYCPGFAFFLGVSLTVNCYSIIHIHINFLRAVAA